MYVCMYSLCKLLHLQSTSAITIYYASTCNLIVIMYMYIKILNFFPYNYRNELIIDCTNSQIRSQDHMH